MELTACVSIFLPIYFSDLAADHFPLQNCLTSRQVLTLNLEGMAPLIHAEQFQPSKRGVRPYVRMGERLGNDVLIGEGDG